MYTAPSLRTLLASESSIFLRYCRRYLALVGTGVRRGNQRIDPVQSYCPTHQTIQWSQRPYLQTPSCLDQQLLQLASLEVIGVAFLGVSGMPHFMGNAVNQTSGSFGVAALPKALVPKPMELFCLK